MVTSQPLALVIGASSGMGHAFARRLAGQGFDLVVTGCRQDHLDAIVAEFPERDIRPLVADLGTLAGIATLGTLAGIATVADACEREAISMLINNAGVAHYKGFTKLSEGQLSELLHVKVMAPTMLARAVAPGMVARGDGAIVNVPGMLAFGAAAPLGQAPGRAVYVASLAHIVALSQALHVELNSKGLKVQALCPGIVATEFHERQGMDLSAIPRMSADDVVTASLRPLELGEVVCAPGLERSDLLNDALQADLAAFGAQSPGLAERYL